MIHHFDLAIEVHEDGSATASLSDPGSFDVPIAEATGPTPEAALTALTGLVSIPVPEPGPYVQVNGTVYPIVPGVPAGCSSPNGHYVGMNVVMTALDFGWADTMAAAAAETYDEHYADEDWPHRDHWYDMVTDAERWLNEHTEGAMWHWADGDFRVDLVEDCPVCGSQRFADPEVGDGDVNCGNHLSWD